MAVYGITGWKKAPFLRVFPALAGGILLEWYTGIDEKIWWWLLPACTGTVMLFSFLPLFSLFKHSFAPGIATTFLFISLGAILISVHDTRNDPKYFGRFAANTKALLVFVDEPPAEKAKSFKTIAVVKSGLINNRWQSMHGRIIIYFKKDSTSPPPLYGSMLLFSKSPEDIKNNGNPGSFDYKRYCLFRGITHQLYLGKNDYRAINEKQINPFSVFIYKTREQVLHIIRQFIPREPEKGLAEALLVGYKDDLDRSLVQSYTNTGVVHIIAISGLHLGLIYWLLQLACKPLRKNRKTKWMTPLIVLSGLWLFSFLAGAQASVLRSALMFSCLILGGSLSRKTSMLNSMAVSASILVIIDPFCLWDVGFQLSYSAVLSIILFMRPVYNFLNIKNKILDSIWKLNSVTIAAQILTLPLSIYHFHQFPVYFILTNLVAVPLSSLVVLGEILLLVISFFTPAAVFTGKALLLMISIMNTWIKKTEALPFSLWSGMQISMTQVWLLFACIAFFSLFLRKISVKLFMWSLCCLMFFLVLRSVSFIQCNKTKAIIVYHIPHKQAIDFITGRHYYFCGNQDIQADSYSRNFYMQPARTLFRTNPAEKTNSLPISGLIYFSGKKILLVNSEFINPVELKPDSIDVMVISGIPKFSLKKLNAFLFIRQMVTDGTVSSTTAVFWKKQADSLHIPIHDTNRDGAFVMTLN